MAGVFTETERAGLEGVILEGSEITPEWLEGIRKGWTQVQDDLIHFEGRLASVSPGTGADALGRVMGDGRRSLVLLGNYVKLLSQDLLHNKGIWTLPSKAGAAERNPEKRWRSVVINGLDEAGAVVKKYLDLNQEKLDLIAAGELSPGDYEKLVKRAAQYVDHAVGQVDTILKDKVFDALAGAVAYKQGRGSKLDLGAIEPDVAHIGSMTIIFADVPEGSPTQVGTETTTAAGDTKTVLKPIIGYRLDHKKRVRAMYRDPKTRDGYLRVFQSTWDYLKSCKLEWLAGGDYYVMGQGRTHYSNTQADYRRDKDNIRVYGEPTERLIGTLIHELAHRYWYKFMTPAQREGFSSWFKKVKPVSEYGGTAPWEDFAETFMHYVLRKKLTRDQRDRFLAFMKTSKQRVEMIEGSPTAPQKCKFCDEPASMSLIWADGRAYVPVCRAHERKARNVITSQNDSVCDVKQVDQQPATYREHVFLPAARLQAAQEPAPSRTGPEPPGTYFGLQGANGRAASALQEAPPNPTPRAPIGRRDVPRGAVIQTRTGDDIMGVTGEPIKRATGKGLGKGTSGPERVYQMPDRTRQEIPDSLLQMLGSDWTTMRAHRDHDNRMTVSVDGVRYTVYTRRG